MPSFSSSPCIRGAPQRGFASAISRITVRMLAGIVGRPTRRRLLQVHHSWKPRRCHAMTVSGLTMTSAVRHPVQRRESRTQSHRSAFASRTRWVGSAAAPPTGAARPGFRGGARRANVSAFAGSRGASAAPRSSPRSVSIVGRNINRRRENRLFSRDKRARAPHKPSSTRRRSRTSTTMSSGPLASNTTRRACQSRFLT
jgi:hypothetical protein